MCIYKYIYIYSCKCWDTGKSKTWRGPRVGIFKNVYTRVNKSIYIYMDIYPKHGEDLGLGYIYIYLNIYLQIYIYI